MVHLDLFSGIGGFALAAERVWPDIEHVFCEIDPFCRTILKKHWPNSYIYEDIKALTNANGAGLQTTGAKQQTAGAPGVDLLTGGFPCQPFSAAGKRKGTNDDRHLWPEMRRVIQEFRPRHIVAENVRGLLSIDGGLVFETVCADLEALGYEVQPFVIPACAVNAPHRRDRVWIVAHAKHESTRDTERGRIYEGASTRATRSNTDAPNAEGRRRRDGLTENERAPALEVNASSHTTRLREHAGEQGWAEPWPQVAARLCRVDDGLPEGMARPRGWRSAALKAYGNAIVPQVAEQILRSIQTWRER